MEASVLDLRKRMHEVMSAINRHERVTLTYRGRRKAIIVPLSEATSSRTKVEELPAFGIWADRSDMADPVAFVKQIRKPRKF